MSKICVNCVKEINGKEAFCLSCHEEVVETAKKKISDLEAKLAEKDQELNDICQNYDFQINDFSREVYRLQKREKILEQQLAEKEGKIETLKQRIGSIVKIYSDDFVSKDAELKELRYKVKQHNQDKISFAVEQLEKVKELINNKLEFMWQNNAEMTCRDRHIIEKCYEDIDELITEIKERNQDE